MTKIEKPEEAGLELYEPGIPPAEVNTATLGRFLPASMLGLGLMFFGVFGMPLSEFIFVPLMLAPLVAGFWGGLRVLRRWLYPDAELSGRRSVLAGFLAPLVMMIVEFLMPWLGPVPFMGVSALIGVFLGLALFFAWLTPTPEDLRAPGWYEADPDDEEGVADDGTLMRVMVLLRRSIELPSPGTDRRRRLSGRPAASTS